MHHVQEKQKYSFFILILIGQLYQLLCLFRCQDVKLWKVILGGRLIPLSINFNK